MTILDRKNLDPQDQSIQDLLEQLQGNILKGHGRDHTVHIFFRFTGDPKESGALITDLAAHVTSANRQRQDTVASRGDGPKSLPFCNLFLTFKGYKGLGYSESELIRAFPETPRGPDRVEPQVKFVNGMAFHQAHLADPRIGEWEKGYADPKADTKQVIDGMVLLANDDLRRLDDHEQTILRTLGKRAEMLVTERGRALFNEDRSQNLEHFGYVDGRSQPIFFQEDFETEDMKGGTGEWDPSEPLGLVLVPDGLAPDNEKQTSFGSYFVFRKLEQNVKGFKTKEKELAESLGFEGEEAELAGALAVGRFEDGTPVVLQDSDGLRSPVPNNFRFDRQDRDGLKCPFHAHIRKVNPRGETNPGDERLEVERSHRIARRGITYGERSVEPKDDPDENSLPEKGVGLLFMCFQANIDNQFAYLQRRFANNPDFIRPGTGIDPVIGPLSAGESCPQKWSVKWGNQGSKSFNFPSFVKLLGGEFLFAPSIAFLKKPLRS